MTEILQVHTNELCYAQDTCETDWSVREVEFEKAIYFSKQDAIDEVIRQMIEDHQEYCDEQFSTFDNKSRSFFDVEKTINELKRPANF